METVATGRVISLFSFSFCSFLLVVDLFCQHVFRQPSIKVFIVACHSKLYLPQATCDWHNNNARQCQTQMTSYELEREACLLVCPSACLPNCLSLLSVSLSVSVPLPLPICAVCLVCLSFCPSACLSVCAHVEREREGESDQVKVNCRVHSV